jgi:hypothetical protein
MTGDAAPTYCANHPTVETTLRCNKCGKLICARCALRTPTGYRCRECVREHQRSFDTALWSDFVLGFITAAVLSLIASLLVGLISGITGIFAWFIILAAASAVGMVIAEAVRFVTRRHRSRPLFLTVAAGVLMGGLPSIILNLLSFSLFGLIFEAIFLVIVVPVVYTRLSGIQLTR